MTIQPTEHNPELHGVSPLQKRFYIWSDLHKNGYYLVHAIITRQGQKEIWVLNEKGYFNNLNDYKYHIIDDSIPSDWIKTEDCQSYLEFAKDPLLFINAMIGDVTMKEYLKVARIVVNKHKKYQKEYESILKDAPNRPINVDYLLDKERIGYYQEQDKVMGL